MAGAEYVEKLRAICSQCEKPATRNQRLIDGILNESHSCSSDRATRNQRLIDGEPAHVDDQEVMVGVEESYEARSRDCQELRTD